MRAASVLTAVVLSLSGAAPCAAQEEMLANPGFDELTGEGLPAGWQVDEGLQVLSGDDAREGHGVRVRYHNGLRQEIAVEPGEMFRISGYTRRPPGEPPLSGRLVLRWLDDEGRKVRGNSDLRHHASAEWSRFTHLISIPEGCTRLQVVVDGPYQTTDWFDFDQLSMVPTSRLASIDPGAIHALHGRSLRVIRVADCRSFALLRLPGWMDRPFDGKVDTVATMSPYHERPNRRTEVDFDFTLHRPERVSFVLIHTVSQPLERATLFAEADGDWRHVAELRNDSRTLLGATMEPVVTRRLRLRLHKRPEEESIALNEVQFFDLGPPPEAASGPGLALAEAPPEGFAEILERAGSSRLALVGGDGDAGLALEGGRTLDVVSPAYESATGLDGLRLRIACEGGEPGRAVEVALLSPNIRDRSVRYIHIGDRVLTGRYASGLKSPPNVDLRDLFRVAAPLIPDGGEAVAELEVDIPDMLIRPGERLWLRITPLADETLRLGSCAVQAVKMPVEDALAEYLPDLERILRRAYSQCSEAHVYDGAEDREAMALVRLVREVQALDPGNEVAAHMEHRALRTRARVDLQRPGPADAPDWAVWQRELLRRYAEVVHWWIDNRQVSTGELGGMWADDTELSCEWAFLPLVTGDEAVRDSLALIAEGIWDVVGDGGYSPRTMDAEHAAEYVTLSQPFMMLLDYGDPLYVERCMRMIENMQWWTLVNEHGHRHFRSYMFNATDIDDSEGKDFDHATTTYACKPGFYAAWYSASEQPRGWLSEWGRGWHAAAMSAQKGKPVGGIPFDIHAKTGEIAPYTDRWNRSAYMNDGITHVKDLLMGAWDWTGDPAIAEPLRYQASAVNEPDMLWRVLSGETDRDEAVIEAAERMIEDNHRLNGSDEQGSWSAYSMYTELRYYWAWWATGQMRYLVEGLQEQVRNLQRMRWLITEAEPYTDRAYIPGDRLLPFTMLGGTGGEVRAIYPDFAVSWEGIGTDVATLVTQRSDQRLRVMAYSFAQRPIEAVMRTWSLPHGLWEVTVGIDEDGGGRAEGQRTRRRQELFRHAAVALTLQPGETTVIEARLVERLDDIRERPDLAIADRDVVGQDGALQVRVHNIGAADAPTGITVQATDAEGETIASADLGELPAPESCRPSTATVTLVATGAAQVMVDAGDALAEITEVNNVVELH
ncbi:MAG: hypothetical protein U9R79_03255 [Armatimonadota bacterium]|nr:hypothetical protein [Armatimonadota bacterium]